VGQHIVHEFVSSVPIEESVWPNNRHRFEENCIELVRAFGSISIMIWSGRQTNLTLSPPGIIAERYMEEILRLHIMPMGRQIYLNAILP